MVGKLWRFNLFHGYLVYSNALWWLVGFSVAMSIIVFLRKKTPRRWLSKRDWNHRRNIDRSYRHMARMVGMNGGQKTWYLRNKVTNQEFEEIVLTALKLKGLDIKRNKKYTGDGGVDGVVYVGGEQVIIQSKRYNGPIQKAHVNSFIALVEAQGGRGLFVTCGRSSEPIRLICREHDRITLISGRKLDWLLDHEQPWSW